jgi:hypothetical protein
LRTEAGGPAPVHPFQKEAVALARLELEAAGGAVLARIDLELRTQVGLEVLLDAEDVGGRAALPLEDAHKRGVGRGVGSPRVGGDTAARRGIKRCQEEADARGKTCYDRA